MCLPAADSELARFLRGIDMEIGVFIPSGSQFDNDIPEPSRRRGNPFWTFLTPVLGLQPEHLPWHNEGVSREIAEIRAYEARRGEANNSVPPRVTLADLAQEAVTHVVDAVKSSKLTEARLWVAKTLAPGPMKATRLEKLAKSAGVAPRTLRRALKALKVQRSRNRDKTWTLSLIQAEPEAGQGEVGQPKPFRFVAFSQFFPRARPPAQPPAPLAGTGPGCRAAVPGRRWVIRARGALWV
jgi:hypothetical protein